ncbi:Xanthine/uracil/vitamin C permease [Pseudonocardia dioxanivorans CB1190]|uniref:Xanthine/uracil/vitamin C permease n=1 Tax=Pseudonocardia dioxanivorans (strain ATCC 55486 / DSM 44775 / JCM 13855 / CB1190) TaxID=675635 RepID=F4CVD8_PSEUX|nr:xanthine/uracil/vitamin C permease [Pseudonocardia dioxanivorans]AEA23437.1 Xanthine/uracil/vitamin C permease [Pseudonocardia dioxanivorans CB1190]
MSETSEPTVQPITLSWWVSGDTNAFFGLGFNTLVNVLTLSGLCLAVVNIPGSDVFGVILPALGVQLLIGNVYYTYLARRLARREGRTDVCAMPYGPSVPHMFIVVFVIMLPVYLQTKNPLTAWAAGLAWSFIIGVIVLLGAFVGPFIRRYTPQAAMLGTLAGVSIAFISMRPAAQMWEALWIALPVMVIILIGFFTDLRLPGNIPVGLAALLVGTAIGWIGGYMSAPDVVTAAKDVALSLPTADLGRLGDGLADVAPLLATAIPLGIYNFTEGMTNIESAAVAGDEYNMRAILAADGTGAIVGSVLGCPFPPAVYIGHPGWKAAGGRTTYSLASGVVIALMCFLGLFGLLGAILPTPAIVPILLYIGLLIGAQAFQETPRRHAVAVVIAIIPNIASWAAGLMDNALSAAGTSAAQVGDEALTNAGLVYHGTVLLGGGAILAGLVLGSITAFVIDKNFFAAAAYSAIGAVVGFFGLIHAPQVGWNVGGQIALGYLFAAVVLGVFGLVVRRRGVGGDGVRTDQPVAADLVGAEPGEGVPTPRHAAEPAAAPIDLSDGPGRPATA